MAVCKVTKVMFIYFKKYIYIVQLTYEIKAEVTVLPNYWQYGVQVVKQQSYVACDVTARILYPRTGEIRFHTAFSHNTVGILARVFHSAVSCLLRHKLFHL
jgi:hypothetical protein